MLVAPLLCGKKMSGKRSVFITDAALVPLFAAVLATGVRLHVAGETQSHDVWHVWAVWHTLAGIAFLALVFLHLRHHWGWYKGWRKRSVRRNGVTWLLSLSFAVTVLTGALLLACVEGAGSPTGWCHYVAGLVAGICGIRHMAARWPVLRKGLGRRP